jgi:hypothetical protein
MTRAFTLSFSVRRLSSTCPELPSLVGNPVRLVFISHIFIIANVWISQAGKSSLVEAVSGVSIIFVRVFSSED